ncbi:multidrug efflux transporter outer membrane subunit SmeC [Stenotrophomonas maltophilia]|uniref:multidrug efflux transporter outer membrane subunit SmeC n=1 Tax=Stenotrophomonas maltophilia TaxID=40324 RepID=UPI000DA3EB65|nr:multidrug efflux transporter outer membrane subunit SmeC [Stenotrophomonas maltophilia]SQG12355.1 RND efflux system, outer membrane lipoprotein [Stenotrophomonas maltophilia]
MKPMLLRALAAATMTTVLGGCVSMAPHYQRPEAPVPAQFGNAGTGEAEPALAMPAWRDVFLEPRLQQVIALALQNNRDLRVAVLQVEKERAQYRIQRAALLPSVDASGSVTRSRVSDANSETGVTQLTESDAVQVGISSWELDLFGRIRSLKNEALQNWLASAENQRAARTSLVAEVATAWLALAADEQSLAFTQQTLDSQQQTLQRTEARHAQGLASGLDLSQVQTSVEAARGALAKLQTQQAQDRDALQLLVGAPLDPALLPTAQALDGSVALAPLPANLPSSVLLQRPDVLSAEHALQAANADIGAARAAFFPTLALTANYGHSSTALSTLFSAGTRGWSFAPSITAPIFHAGALKASLDASKIGKDIGIAQYEKAIQQAFSEVADALATRDHLTAQLDAQRALVADSQRSYTLADARYRTGLDGYLQSLDAQRSLYAAQQDLIALQQQEAGNRVTLFKVLGGGADAR